MDFSDSVTTLLSIEAAKKGVTTITETLLTSGKKHLAKKFADWKRDIDLETLYLRLQTIRRVKTILQPESEVDLASFYYQTHIDLPKQGDQSPTRIAIDDVDHFPHSGNILITGTVGQGKSMFMRYLASRELVRARHLPLFAELRRIKDGRTLESFLRLELETLGLKLDSDLFESLCAEGKIILFLDGVDEIPDERREDMLNDVDHFLNSHPATRAIISSRPGAGAEGLPSLRRFRLSNLSRDEYPTVICHLIQDPHRAQALIEALSRTSITHLLSTPLMIALVVVRFRIEETVPENEISFFDDLFDLLIRRHDGWKGGFRRERRTSVGDQGLRETFYGICYLWKRRQKNGEFTWNDLCELAKEASGILQVNETPDNIAEDICKITNLIMEEGGMCRFVHKSVQEFHAARCIKCQADSNASDFYRSMRSTWRQWTEELKYSSQLDTYRYCKYFAIPDALAALDLAEGKVPLKWTSTAQNVDLLIRGAVTENNFSIRQVTEIEIIYSGADGLEVRVSSPRTASFERVYSGKVNGSPSAKEIGNLAITAMREDPRVRQALQPHADVTCSYIHGRLLRDIAFIRSAESIGDAFRLS